jgi:hypothetical protein
VNGRLAARAWLAGLVGACIGAFAHAQDAPGAFVLLGPAALSIVWVPRPVRERLARGLSNVARLWMAVTSFFALLSSIYPIFSEQTVDRTGLFLGYGLSVLSVLFLLGRRSFATATLLIASSVGAMATASLQPRASLGLFHLAAALCLVGHAFTTADTLEARQHARRNRLWRAARLAVYVAVVSALALGIKQFLPWAQPHVEEATARAFNPSYAVSQAAFSEHARLGSVEELALSRRVVLRLWADRPHKLRARVLVDFDGQTWHGVKTVPRPLLASAAALPADLEDWLKRVDGRSFVDEGAAGFAQGQRARIVFVLEMAGPLMTPSGTGLLKLRAEALAQDAFGIVPRPPELVEAYAAVQGEQAAGEPFAVPREKYLAVHPDTDARLLALAARLGAGARTPEERLALTTGYLGRELEYSLSPGKFHSRQPLAEFVFEKKKGYCEYFASAAAILLRLQGVPTRYVSGFSPSDDSRLAGHYVVRESDAHAWIEAFLPGKGWVEVDPTPPSQLGAFRDAQREGFLSRVWEWLKAAVAALWQEARFDSVIAVLRSPAAWLVLALLVGGGLAPLLRGRRGKGTAPAAARRDLATDVPPEIARLLADLDAAWVRRGHPRPSHRAPLEHLFALPEATFSSSARRASERALLCFYAARFAGRTAPPAEVHEIGAEMERALRLSPRRDS